MNKLPKLTHVHASAWYLPLFGPNLFSMFFFSRKFVFSSFKYCCAQGLYSCYSSKVVIRTFIFQRSKVVGNVSSMFHSFIGTYTLVIFNHLMLSVVQVVLAYLQPT